VLINHSAYINGLMFVPGLYKLCLKLCFMKSGTEQTSTFQTALLCYD
jgi:hypothetical protein